MSLIKSISGIRGTIGGSRGDALTPPDIVSFASAYGQWIFDQAKPISGNKYCVVVGRDARISGEMVESLVCNTLLAMGIDVIKAGLATTPTVEMAVVYSKADGGIILTASHNPAHWNALKLLNNKGEFLSADDGKRLLDFVEKQECNYAEVNDLGQIREEDFLDQHIQSILKLPLVDKESISKKGFKVLVDAVNSVGGFAIPRLLTALGVENQVVLNGNPDGHFAHNPEPLPENLIETCQSVVETGMDMGIVVDPDVDRLAFICEDGSFFGEEYTLVAVCDYILRHEKGSTVSNLSSSRALKDVSLIHSCNCSSAAVGEVNVVEKMKETNAIIGGEGNGGIIYPKLHYGRDALVGVALFLTHLAKENVSLTELRKRYPSYYMSKNKIQLSRDSNPDLILSKIQTKYQNSEITTIDGVKIDFPDSWVHMRKSNTEPIIRIYTEAGSQQDADDLARRFIQELADLE